MPAIRLQNTVRLFYNFAALSLVLFAMAGCHAYSGRSFKPQMPGYPDKSRKVFVLDKELLEISGQVNIGNDLFAGINDEDGKIFIFRPDSHDIQNIRFAKKGDYEDIAKVDSTFYVMDSDGDLHEIVTSNGAAIRTHRHKFEVEKKVEFESLVYYQTLQKLVLITKDHALNHDAIVAFSFDLRSKQFDTKPMFEIPMRDVLRKLKDYSAQCKPSAAALHPKTGKLFLLASVGKCLIQCSPDGKVEYAYDLNPDQFQQPEGISFATNGDMYISNEGLQGKATMLLFPYQPELQSKK